MSNPPRRKHRIPKVVYSRELPGGGYVSILAEPTDESAIWRGWISVERRSDLKRRDGTQVPVIAETTGPSQDSIYQTLFDIAADNVAVARAIRRWEAEHSVAPGS